MTDFNPFEKLGVRWAASRLLTAATRTTAPSHPVSADRLRSLLNGEVDLERAWRLREADTCP